MHKFKNKQTGEVITTPYQAEAEEYRNNDNYIEVNMSKPVYTKEMHERGELPPVGSFAKFHGDVVEVLINEPDADNCIIIILKGEYLPVNIGNIKPVKAVEDEIMELIDRARRPRNCTTRILSDYGIVKIILEKYNITPKDS